MRWTFPKTLGGTWHASAGQAASALHTGTASIISHAGCAHVPGVKCCDVGASAELYNSMNWVHLPSLFKQQALHLHGAKISDCAQS